MNTKAKEITQVAVWNGFVKKESQYENSLDVLTNAVLDMALWYKRPCSISKETADSVLIKAKEYLQNFIPDGEVRENLIDYCITTKHSRDVLSDAMVIGLLLISTRLSRRLEIDEK